MSLAIHCFVKGVKITPRFPKVMEDEIVAKNEAALQANTKKATEFGL